MEKATRTTQITFLDAIKNLRKNVFSFSGRTSRREYWFCYAALSTGVAALHAFFLTLYFLVYFATVRYNFDYRYMLRDNQLLLGLPPVALLVCIYLMIVLLIIIIGTALDCRRLHDLGWSGWWSILSFIPFGSLVLFILFLSPSKPDNKYGAEPAETL